MANVESKKGNMSIEWEHKRAQADKLVDRNK